MSIGATYDQYLFELNVKLQYSDDERNLLPALEELAAVAAADFPPEALLQRQAIMVRAPQGGRLENALGCLLLPSPTYIICAALIPPVRTTTAAVLWQHARSGR